MVACHGVATLLLRSSTRAAFCSSYPAPANAPELAPDTKVEFSTTPDEGQTTLPTPPPDAPPPRPRHSGLVLEQTLGILGFAGQFGHVAPPLHHDLVSLSRIGADADRSAEVIDDEFSWVLDPELEDLSLGLVPVRSYETAASHPRP